MAPVPRSLRTILLALLLMGTARIAVPATSLWWDTNYQFRINVAVATGANSPDKGYSGYTVRIPALDTAGLIAAGDLQGDCSDLRVTYFDGLAWQEPGARPCAGDDNHERVPVV